METVSTQTDIARFALVQALAASPTGELSEGELERVLKEFFGEQISWENAAELGLVRLDKNGGELTPRPGFTAEFVPFQPLV